MTEEQIFLAALDLNSQDHRSAYLDKACGTDTELRRQVEELLAAHFRSGEFLNEPVGQQLGTTPVVHVDETLVVAHQPDEAAVADRKNPDHDDAAHDGSGLEFLLPTTRPDSLGRISHYEALQVLGKGGFGIVFRAFDDVLQRVVALKVLAPAIAATSPARKRFLREAQASARVRHENVVQVHAVEELPTPYLVMEFIAGETLQQRLDRKGPLEAIEIVRLARQVAEGLAAAHETGLIHRDIKPGNILIEGGANERVKITDFGLARAADDASMTQSGTVAGTPMFMSPEQAQGDTLDQRSDLFSLGSVMYAMASGRPPFRAATTFAVLKRVVEETPRPIKDIIPETPQWLCDIIGRLHEKKPDDRFQSAREVANLLADCEQQLKAHNRVQDLAHLPRREPPAGRTTTPRRFRTAAIAAVTLVVLAGLVWLAPSLGLMLSGQARVNCLTRDGDTQVEFVSGDLVVGKQVGYGELVLPRGSYELRVTKPDPNLRIYNAVVIRRNWLGMYEQVTLSSPPKTFQLNAGDRVDFMVAYVSSSTAKVASNETLRPASSLSANSDVWVSLFNGQNLTGWSPVANAPGKWTVSDGILIGSAGPGYLLADRKYSDFHLRIRTKISAGGDGGVTFRERIQAEINTKPPNVTGSLIKYDGDLKNLLAAYPHSVVPPDTWFTLEIHAQGKNLKVRVNDDPWSVVTYERFATVPLSLKLETQTGTVFFEKIEIKELSGDAARPSTTAPALAVSPFSPLQARQHQDAWAQHLDVKVEFENSLGMKFRLIPPGKFSGRQLASAPWIKSTNVDRAFYAGMHEVTVAQFREFVREKNYKTRAELDGRGGHIAKVGRKPEHIWSAEQFAKDGRWPVALVYWQDAMAFCAWLSEREGRTYRLPTATEWQWFANAGSEQRYFFGDDPSQLETYSWQSIQQNRTHPEPVGTKESNPWGLYDVYGNVSEICIEWFADRRKELWLNIAEKPEGPDLNSALVGFGGGFLDPADISPLGTFWTSSFSHIGFRVVLVEDLKGPMPHTADSIASKYKNNLGMEFVRVPKGKSWLGGGKDKLGDKEVEIPADFYLGKYEVTQEEWLKVMGENPSHFSRMGEGKDAVKDISDAELERFPVESVDWDRCQLFLAKLNAIEQKSGWEYRFPTLDEWEYACRGGPMSAARKIDSASDFYFGLPTNSLLLTQANFSDGGTPEDPLGLRRPCPVGTFSANSLGLFEMHGNVQEWCADTNVIGTDGMPHRVFRGGSFKFKPALCAAAVRMNGWANSQFSDLGLRLARVPVPQQLPSTFTNSLGIESVKVPKGKSWLGGGKDKLGDKEVEIPADFYLGRYEVTQEEWEKVMGENPSHFTRTGGGKDAVKDVSDADLKRFPVEMVSWDQCQNFVAKLNQHERETGWVYRLPTEVEWEYACRGGPMADKVNSAFDFYFAKPTNSPLPKQANFEINNGLKRTCKVGSYEPNVLGLYDMHGNIHESCDDPKLRRDGVPCRVGRGGSWLYGSETGRAAIWDIAAPKFKLYDLGLRLARVPSGAPSPEAETAPFVIAPFTDADVQRIAALAATEQVEEVRKELMRCNPGFDGQFEHKIEGDVVTEFKIVTDTVTDISPIRVWNSLRALTCTGTYTDKPNGLLVDLTPLQGMNLAGLTLLDLSDTKVTDAGMVVFKDCKKLTFLSLNSTKLTDRGLAHFNDCKNLSLLSLGGTGVSDAGLIHFQNCKSLRCLNLKLTKATDVGLVYFQDCKDLTVLDLGGTKMSDTGLARMKGMPLTSLWIYKTDITDLTPLQGMPLEEIVLTPKNITKGLDILRDLKSLKTIGIAWDQSWPAKEFWERYDKGEFGFTPFTDADVQRIAALPAKEQVEKVRNELMKRNPGFDGNVGHKIEDGVVTELRVVTDRVTDISPIRVFSALRVLDCSGSGVNPSVGTGQLADLTPLAGMNLAGLTKLRLTGTKVSDAGLDCFQDCKNLTHLSLASTEVTDAGLVHFQGCKDLTFLGLGFVRVTDSGLAIFADCKKLEVLYLNNTQVSDGGLAHFEDRKNLTLLDVGNTKVTDAGLAPFKDCKNLVELHLWNTKLTDAGLVHFTDCQSLTHLGVAGTKVTNAGLAHFKDHKLSQLGIERTEVTDLSLFKGMPLKELTCDFQPQRDAEILRSIKALEKINGKPAAEFWER